MLIFGVIWKQTKKNKIFRFSDKLFKTAVNTFFIQKKIGDKMFGSGLNLRCSRTLEIIFSLKILI